MPDLVAPAPINRIVFKEVTEGDRRKFTADANDSDKGGGARDLRFRPYDVFLEAFRHLFPVAKQEQRIRNGMPTPVTIHIGAFHWLDAAGAHVQRDASFEPPTDARPDEGRIPVLHKYAPFTAGLPQGRVVLLLVQREDGSVWPHFASVEALASAYAESVAVPVLRCLSAKRPEKQHARGYLDFINGRDYFDA